MKLKIFSIMTLCATSLHAALPTVGYVSEFFESSCHNPNLLILGTDDNNLVSNSYLLTLIDYMNRNNIGLLTGMPSPTTYASELQSDSVVSLGYLNESLNKLFESTECCLGGKVDPETGNCESCGGWVSDDSEVCPDGFVYIELANTELLTDTDTCPVGQIQHYEIPSSCSDYIY